MDYSRGARDFGRNVADRASETFDILKSATAKGRTADVIKTVLPADAPKSLAEQAALLSPSMTMTQPKPAIGAGPSVIAANVELTGSINTPDELHIYGTVEGNVRASMLTICEGGAVKGEVAAQTVMVHGTVEGKIFAQKVQLCVGATVRGDIVHGALGIDTMATFEGLSKRSQNPLSEATAIPSKKK